MTLEPSGLRPKERSRVNHPFSWATSVKQRGSCSSVIGQKRSEPLKDDAVEDAVCSDSS